MFCNLLTDFECAARLAQHQEAAPRLHMRHSGTRSVRKLQLSLKGRLLLISILVGFRRRMMQIKTTPRPSQGHSATWRSEGCLLKLLASPASQPHPLLQVPPQVPNSQTQPWIPPQVMLLSKVWAPMECSAATGHSVAMGSQQLPTLQVPPGKDGKRLPDALETDQTKSDEPIKS